MGYLGGKHRIRYQVSEYVNSLSPRVYLEPFCGYAWVGERVRCQRRYFSDVNESLISMWQALQDGWKPPASMTQREFLAIRELGEMSALRGFIESACVFNGCWGGGFKGIGKWPDPAPSARRALLHRIRSFAGAVFSYRDYLQAMDTVDANVIYCDPPYAGMAQRYKDNWTSALFDSEKFWEEMRKRSNGKRRILVSEYIAPEDFTAVLTINSRLGLSSSAAVGLQREIREERVYEYQPPKGRRMVSFASFT